MQEIHRQDATQNRRQRQATFVSERPIILSMPTD
jgi:hypothetical protein